ncbi:hypothetical protein FS749_012443 [Ceratobasidium sp. UAMH 11750]|nr:hypothetical protein FS749_012443 [Ceratobasidium sp. UAMH 11750]
MPGDQELDVRVDMPGPHNHELNASMHALFHRSHVTQFVAWSLLPDCSSQLAGYLDCLPELQALVLDYSMGAYGSLAALVVENEGRIQARQPGLRTLGVLAGKFDSNAQDWLGRIVSTHHLSELRFGFSTRVVAGPNGGRDLEGMLRSIRRQGQFVVHDYYYRGPEDCNFNLQAYGRD